MPEVRKSILQEAASLPPDAPHILRVAEGVGGVGVAACEIDINDFEAALRDPRTRKFQQEAMAYHDKLIAEGKSS